MLHCNQYYVVTKSNAKIKLHKNTTFLLVFYDISAGIAQPIKHLAISWAAKNTVLSFYFFVIYTQYRRNVQINVTTISEVYNSSYTNFFSSHFLKKRLLR